MNQMISWRDEVEILALLTKSCVMRLGKKVIECLVQQVGWDILRASGCVFASGDAMPAK